MNLGKSVQYAMIVMGYIAKQSDGRGVSCPEMAKKIHISRENLMTVFRKLIFAELLESKRGPIGGFSLAKPASEISLLEIVEAVEGPVRDYYEIAEDAKSQPFAVRMDEIRTKAANQAMAILKKAKLSDMVK